MEIVWTKLAKITYKEILENLKRRWTKKELKNFKSYTEQTIDKIKSQQIIWSYANEKLEIRKVKIHKTVSLFYKEDDVNQKIYMITFFNNRMNPKTLKKLLRD